MLVTLEGMVIEVRPEQPQKALLPMLVTPSGMVMEVRLEQPEKVRSPMLVTLSGIRIEVRLEHLEKASKFMNLVPSFMLYVSMVLSVTSIK